MKFLLDFPIILHHKRLFAGRPGGPAFYISTVDNVQNHGPASQGSGTEADSCFGKIYPQSIPVILPFLTILCGASFLVSIENLVVDTDRR